MKKLIKYFFFIIIFPVLLFLYDLADYDNKYINRSSIVLDKNNLNSRYSKKFYYHYERFLNKLNYQFIWKVETEEKRKNLKRKKIIHSKIKEYSDSKFIYDFTYNFEDWKRSNGNNHSTRFSFLTQINSENIDELKPAWIYRSKDGNKGIQANAIHYKGYLYFPTPGNHIVCLDGKNGKEIWRYKGNHFNVAKRGLLIDDSTGQEIIYFADNDKLFALNAKTGKPHLKFGAKGYVKIKPSVVTPVIYKNKIIVATWYPSIEVIDLDNGKTLWKYYLRNKGEKFKGGNPWGGISLDEKRGIIFITTGNPENYFIGVNRIGSNDYTNSIIAIDINKKKEIWKFQETSHDLWNFDIPAAPILTSINYLGKKIDVAIAITKLGNTLIFERESGNILNDYYEMIVPVSNIKGEKTNAYQKFFSDPEPFAKNIFLPSEVFSFNKKEEKKLYNFVKKNNYGFFPTFKINKKTIIYNFHGGAEWTGASVDSEKGIMYITANNIPWITEIKKKESLFQLNYSNYFKRFFNREGYPASKPPWGTLSAVDLNIGEIVWQVPLGYYKELDQRKIPTTGTENFGGATATASGVIFASGTLDKKIRAFDSKNGNEIWSYDLPNVGSAPPTIYMIDNEQFVFLPVSGGNTLSSGYPKLLKNSDHFIAFKLQK